MNSDALGLLQAIYDEPLDPLLRWVYADWLEDTRASVLAGVVRCSAVDEVAPPPPDWLEQVRRDAPCSVQVWLPDGLLLHARIRRCVDHNPKLLFRLLQWYQRHHITAAVPVNWWHLEQWCCLPIWEGMVRLPLQNVPLNRPAIEALTRSSYLDGLLDLDLSYTELNEAMLRHLFTTGKFTALRSLDLSGNLLSSPLWTLLLQWPVLQQLSRLRLRDVGWQTHALVAFRDGPSLPRLRELVLGPLEPGVEVLCQCATLPGLQRLVLHYPRMLRAEILVSAKWWPQLRSLAILGQTLDDSILALAESLPAGCRLRLPNGSVSQMRARSLERRLANRLSWVAGAGQYAC
ncbi:MAG: hypothetical protein SNJ82_02860 [Gemmataceae bacterium]